VKIEIDAYGDVKIYKIPGKPLLYYMVPVTRPSASEKAIVSTIKEAATRLITISPYRIRDVLQRRAIYKQKILEILRSAPELRIPERRFDFYAEAVVREMVGYGIIDPLVRDDKLEEIMVVGAKKPVFLFHRQYGMMTTNIEFFSEQEIQDLTNRIAREVGRRVDISSPLLDARLPDGSRVNATFPPASVEASTLTIRKFREDPYSIVDLINLNTMSAEVAGFLWLAVEGMGSRPANILISGGAGSGKTTTLNVLAAFIPESERIITIEDSVDADEEIIVFEKNNPRRVKIGEIVEKMIETHGCSYSAEKHEICGNIEDLEVLCFDKNGKIVKKRIRCFIRHRTCKKMFEVILKSGKSIKVTEDHSLFAIDEEGNISAIKTGELKENDFIATPRSLPFEASGLKEVNLLDCLEKLERFFICGEKITCVLKKIPKEYLSEFVNQKTAGGKSAMINLWRRKGSIPVRVFRELLEKNYFSNADARGLCFKAGRSRIKIPAMLEIDQEFLELTGLWLADGCYDKNSIIFSVSEAELKELVTRVAARFGISTKMHSDKFSTMVNSALLKTIMKDVLDLKGNAFTKRAPDWTMRLDNRQIAAFLSGYFSGDGTVGKNEIEWTSASKKLMEDVQTLLLRLGIHGRIAKKTYQKDKTFKGRISSYNNILLFEEIVGFIIKRKMERIRETALKKPATHDCSDIIPLPAAFLEAIKGQITVQHEYYSGKSRFGRRFLAKIAQEKPNEKLKMLAEADIFWDQIEKIIALEKTERTVYDLSVPECENFVCSNVFAHNTAELNLPLKHWIRLESRPPGLEGKGELTLDILTKNSLRMRPDRIIVGEVRHREAFSLFTAMNTGHVGSMGTIHANSAQETIVRITSPPMNVPELMLSGLDLILIEHRLHDKKKGTIRRLTEISEVSGVLAGKAQTQPVFSREPVKDLLERSSISARYIQMLGEFTGLAKKDLELEIKERADFLRGLSKKGIRDMKSVQDATNSFILKKRES